MIHPTSVSRHINGCDVCFVWHVKKTQEHKVHRLNMFNRTEAHVENFGHEDEQLDSDSDDMEVGF